MVCTLYGTEFDPELQRKVRFVIAETRIFPKLSFIRKKESSSKRSERNWPKDAAARYSQSTHRNAMLPGGSREFYPTKEFALPTYFTSTAGYFSTYSSPFAP